MKTRRDFIKTTILAGAGFFVGCASSTNKNQPKIDPTLKYGATKKFTRKFTPRFGMGWNIAGKDPFKRMEFFRDAGFTAVEGVVFVSHKGNKDYSDKEKQLQTDLGKKAKVLGLEMGNVSSMNEKYAATMTEFQLPNREDKVFSKDGLREELIKQMDKTFGVLERLGSKTFIIGAGVRGENLPYLKQLDNVIENMKFCAEYAQKKGFVMEIEPLNTISHPNCFIDNATLGAEIVNAVNSPACKLLYDFFHEQMQVGNLNSLDDDNVWKTIESFHIADAPKRQEPGTGVIDYKAVLDKVWQKGFRGFLGLEHLQSDKTPEREMQILETYRKLDVQS